jgi:hypothetical protein
MGGDSNRGGEAILALATKPFLDVARVLMAEGADPATALKMRHKGSTTVALRMTPPPAFAHVFSG